MSCGVGRRCGSDPTLLWLWHRPVAAAPSRPVAWEPPYAAGAALEEDKKKMTNLIMEDFPVQGAIFQPRPCTPKLFI